MLMNGDANTSSSLEIVEPENRITFSSSIHSNSFDISRDDLILSKDQQSITFHIEDDKKEVKESIFHHSILTNEPPKRNRKEIFSKYKINSPKNHPAQQPTNTNADNEIMRAFDEIFSLGAPKTPTNIGIAPTKNLQPKAYIEPEIGKASQTARPIKSISKLADIQTKTPERNTCPPSKQGDKIGQSSQIGKSSEFFKTPLQNSDYKPKSGINKSNISHISDIEYRISVIDRDNDISRDSSDFAEILNAEIFKDQCSMKSPRHAHEQLVPTTDTRESTPRIAPSFQKQPLSVQPPSMHSPSIQPSIVTTTNKNLVSPTYKQIEQNLQESRFSDVYQRIDMSQSIANSILIRNPRLQIFNQGTNSNGNFMGSSEGIGSLKTFNKSSSFGNLISQEEETLINGLDSQKMMEEASEQKRVPIYLRKAAKSNSFFPNFLHPSVQINVDNENAKLQQLVENFSQALSFLQKILEKIRLKQQKRKEIVALFSNGITLQKFKTCDWESCMHFEHLQLLKPKQSFMVKQWNDSKVEKALGNYRKIVEHHRGIKLNLRDQRGVTKYFEIRKKYWDIQKNLMFITDDMYTRIMCLGLPKHFLQFKKILQQEQVLTSHSEIRVKKTQLEHFRMLRNKNDELCASQVGSAVIKKLTNEIKFNSAVY